MTEEFKEGMPIKLGNEPYEVEISKTGMGFVLKLQLDNGKDWKELDSKEIFNLLHDGIKFRKLKEAEQIKKEL